MAQRFVPGFGYLNETSAGQRFVPGVGYVTDSTSGGGGGGTDATAPGGTGTSTGSGSGGDATSGGVIGILASQIISETATGDHGPGLLYDEALANPGTYLRLDVTSYPASGTLTVYANGSFELTGAADGTYTIGYQYYVDDVLSGSDTAVVVIGADAAVAPGGAGTSSGSGSGGTARDGSSQLIYVKSGGEYVIATPLVKANGAYSVADCFIKHAGAYAQP